MHFKQLRYFVHVAELGSFSRAAVHLRVAQPALSRQIQLLEQELGVALLTRDGRGARVTPAGADLFKRAVRLLGDLADMKDAVAAHANLIYGTVTVAVPPSVGATLIPQVLVAIRETYPDLQVKVLESSSIPILEEWLASGRVDIAVLNAAARISQSLYVDHLFKESLYLVGNPEAMTRFGAKTALASLVDVVLILPQPAHGIRMMFEAACNEKGITLEPDYEADSIAIMKQLAIMGAGYTILPGSVVISEVNEGKLEKSQIVEPELVRELLVATATERPLTAAGKEVEAMLRHHAKALDIGTTDAEDN